MQVVQCECMGGGKLKGGNWWNFVLKKEDWPRSVEACLDSDF